MTNQIISPASHEGNAHACKLSTGYCRKCAAIALSRDAEVVAKRNRANQWKHSDPDYKRRHAEACRASKLEKMKDPVFLEALRQGGRTTAATRAGTIASANPESRAKAGEAVRRKALAWCPEEFWPLNEILKRKGYLLAERQAMILAEIREGAESAGRAVRNRIEAQRRRHAGEVASRY